MQKKVYTKGAQKWLRGIRKAIIGSPETHNASPLYDQYLFKGFDTQELVALEYGCGPARNIINWHNRFARIDGVDFKPVIETARTHLDENNIPHPNLLVTDGNSIPTADNTYDVVYSVICLQHICSHSIRMDIFKEIFRVLKPGGRFCAQMGMGREDEHQQTNVANGRITPYHVDNYAAEGTNGGADCSVEDQEYLKKDLRDIGFTNYASDITLPVTSVKQIKVKARHSRWIWFQVEKGI